MRYREFAAGLVKKRRRYAMPNCDLRRQGRAFQYHQLEDRRLLAANIELVDAYLIDGNLNRIASPVLGEQVAIRAEWQTTELPSGAQYQIAYEVDGVELRSPLLSWGAGQPTGSFSWWRSGWYAASSLHDVTVIADVDDQVTEMDESDNSTSFSFTPHSANISFKLQWPLLEQPYSETGVFNYTDIDPTAGIRDYNGGAVAYDGHSAIDAGSGLFEDMDAGVPLLAAADGVVTAIRDGEFDRQIQWINGAQANYVIIDHGSGWETRYWHLRRDSVQVEVGQAVSAGDFLGYMGSSGFSSALHIHFSLLHHGRNVEPMFDPDTFWEKPFGYVLDDPFVFNSGVTNYSPTAHGTWEGASRVTDWAQQSGQLTYVWARFSGLRQGDLLQYQWHRPNGSVYTTGSFTIPQDYQLSWWWFSRFLPSVPDLGTWRVDFKVDGVKIGEQTFDVTVNGAPEARIEDLSTNIILDNRFTPIDFGDVPAGGTDPTQSFRVYNHGDDDLILGGIEVPDNYYVVDGLPGLLAPGASNVFTIAMDATTTGYHAGDIRIPTNDADEPIYNFSVEGFVEGDSDKLILGISERQMIESHTIVGNLRRFGNTSSPLTVSLSSSDGSELSVPTTVTFPAGSNYLMFEIDSRFDGFIDGDQVVSITAAALGYSSASNEIVVVDDGNSAYVDTLSFAPQPGESLSGSRGFPNRPTNSLVGILTNQLSDLRLEGSQSGAVGSAPGSATDIGTLDDWSTLKPTTNDVDMLIEDLAGIDNWFDEPV